MTHFSQDIQYTVYLKLSPYDQIKLPMLSHNLKLGKKENDILSFVSSKKFFPEA